MQARKLILPVIGAVVLMSALVVAPAGAAPALSSASATRQIPISGTSSPQTGDYTPSGSGDTTQVEFPGALDGEEGAEAYDGVIVDRSLSGHTGQGASISSGKKAKS